MLFFWVNFGTWMYSTGARVVALPLRIIIGAVYIFQGVRNFGNDASTVDLWTRAGSDISSQAAAGSVIINLSDYGFGDAGTISLGVLLCVAGAFAIVGLFCRVVGGLMTFIILTNLFAGFTLAGFIDHSDLVVDVIQSRMLLGVCSLVLFFVGAGIFAMDDIIFAGLKRAIMRGEKDKGDGGGGGEG